MTPLATTVERVEQQRHLRRAAKKRALLAELFERPGDDARPRLHAHQARRRPRRRAPGGGRRRRPPPSTATRARASASGRSRAFKAGKVRALVATDIAARGIDIDERQPRRQLRAAQRAETYVHRIGRTARAGAEGMAISLCDDEERVYLKDIEKLTRQQIPSDDRRNDAGLKADERAPNEKHNSDRRRDMAAVTAVAVSMPVAEAAPASRAPRRPRQSSGPRRASRSR